MSPSDDAIRETRNDNIGRSFLRLYRDFVVRCAPKLIARGHGGLSEAHLNVLIYIDAGGTRIVKLAERANMTKQSMGDLIHELENQGYVERTPDPNDKRAAIITFTERGKQFLVDAYRIKQEIEAEYAAILGSEGMEQLQSLMAKLLEHAASDPIG